MKKGDIILIPFPFTNLTGSKNRPALVLTVGEMDVILAFISTQLGWMEKTDVLLNPDSENGLKKTSIVRLSKIATIDKSLALGRIGTLNIKDLDLINKNLKKILKLD
jgi:mRNA interferase MazF